MCLQPNVCRREKVIWEFSEFRTEAALKTRNNFSRWERERIKRPFFNRHRWNGILQFFMDFMLFGFAISTVLFYLLHSAICICVCTLASRTCFVLPNRLPHFIMLVSIFCSFGFSLTPYKPYTNVWAEHMLTHRQPCNETSISPPSERLRERSARRFLERENANQKGIQKRAEHKSEFYSLLTMEKWVNGSVYSYTSIELHIVGPVRCCASCFW